jgi:hypothetical protein
VNFIITWVVGHQVLATLIVCAIFSAAVDALPTPAPDSTKFYGWFYKFINGVAINFSKLSIAPTVANVPPAVIPPPVVVAAPQKPHETPTVIS